MTKKRTPAIFLFCSWLACTAGTAQAGFIGLDDSLAYDDASNRIWYTGFDLGGSMDEVSAVLASMSTTAVVNGQLAQLEWSWASLNQVNSITFTENETLDAFGVSLAAGDGWHAFWGYCSDSQINEFGESEHLSSLRGVHRLSESELDWWQDYSPDGFADFYNPYPYANGPFWLVAEVVGLSPLPVAEPSSLLLVLGGLLGAAGFRRLKKA